MDPKEIVGLPDLDVEGKTALVRADLNVPLRDGEVGDDFRLRAALPTITELRRRGARVVLCSHLGRPHGPDPALSMSHVGPALALLGGFPVEVAADVAGDDAHALASAAGDAVVLLENTRFEEGEKGNDPRLAEALASLADVFVMDAFGSAHRAHASTTGVATLLPSAAGLLMAEELRAFSRLLEDPARPFVVVLGGAKVSDKLGLMRALLPKVEVMLIGGAMAFTVLAAEGFEVGHSRVEDDMEDEVKEVLESPHGARISTPVDVVVAPEFSAGAPAETVAATDMPGDAIGLDIGPETADRYAQVLAGASTIFWNGPMGVFEWERFAGGTKRIAAAVTGSPAYSVVGGGDSVAALRALGIEDQVEHLSTGGGAGLVLIEKGTLPAIETLRRSHGP